MDSAANTPREPCPFLSKSSALFSFASGRVHSISLLGQRKAKGTNPEVVICLAFPHWSSKESSLSSRERRGRACTLKYTGCFLRALKSRGECVQSPGPKSYRKATFDFTAGQKQDVCLKSQLPSQQYNRSWYGE